MPTRMAGTALRETDPPSANDVDAGWAQASAAIPDLHLKARAARQQRWMENTRNRELARERSVHLSFIMISVRGLTC